MVTGINGGGNDGEQHTQTCGDPRCSALCAPDAAFCVDCFGGCSCGQERCRWCNGSCVCVELALMQRDDIRCPVHECEHREVPGECVFCEFNHNQRGLEAGQRAGRAWKRLARREREKCRDAWRATWGPVWVCIGHAMYLEGRLVQDVNRLMDEKWSVEP